MSDLRELLTAEANRQLPEVIPPFEALLGRARRRRRRQLWTASMATAAVIGGGTLGAVSLAHGGGGGTEPSGRPTPGVRLSHVAAVDRRAWPPRRTSLATPPPPLYRACTAAQLRAASGGTIPGLASIVVLTNASQTRCSVSGYPTTLIGVHGDGSRQKLRVWDHWVRLFASWYSWPADMRPGAHAKIAVIWSTGCASTNTDGPATQYVGVVLGLPKGGTVSAPAKFDSICDVGYSRFGTEPPATRSHRMPR
jgi:Protein of unknown function (DUF4232)